MKHFAIRACAVSILVVVGCARAHAQPTAQTGTTSIKASAYLDSSLIARSLPRVVYRGGPFIRHPRIVTVTFKSDDPQLVARLEQFGNVITRTQWWREVTEGYCANGECIGEGRPGAHVQIEADLPARLSDVEVEDILAREVKAKSFNPLDADTLLLIYLPKGVVLLDAFVPHYCSDGPRAYHRALRIDKLRVAYAVLPRCGGEADLTATASHEIVEATTNPDPSARGFAFVQSSSNLGFTAAGIEPVDPCGLINKNNRVLESGFVVQRAWSNAAASRGENPCAPSDHREPYITLVPHESTIRLTQVGASATVMLEPAANHDVPEWAASAIELGKNENAEPCLKVSLDTSKFRVNQTAYLYVTLLKPDAHRVCVAGVLSTLGANSYIWPIAVITR